MDAGDGWHVAGGESLAQDKTIINRIMLRFRPIAPKPAAVGSSSGPISPDKNSPHLTGKRVKRKYIRVGKINNNSGSGRRLINTSSSAEEETPKASLDSAIVTLQLMPEKTDFQGFPGTGSWCSIDPAVAKIRDNRDLPTWMNLKDPKMSRSVANKYVSAGPDRTAVVPRVMAVVPRVMAVESWVTVESVTDTCMDVRGLGCTDVEKMRILEKDTCPGFISDDSNRVKWVNEAYKRMVVRQCEEQQAEAAEVIVWLVTKANLPPYAYPGFTCRVRVQYYTWQKEKCSKMVPCDVWRMECGLAWRLDIKAALSLGL
ncbi:hypothetical protein CerSpe_133440 [Prunus speciosa]